MEKLLKLLDKYEGYRHIEEQNRIYRIMHGASGVILVDITERLLTYTFSFIDWLVKNKYIEGGEVVICQNKKYQFPDIFDFTDQLTMSLSISYNPINDLIQLLN